MEVAAASAEVARRAHVRIGDVAAVCTSALLTAALVLPTYARRPFWFDELVSVEAATSGWSALVDYVATVEANMGLYHLFLSLWLTVAEGEAWARALSVIFSIATLPVLYGLAIRLFDRRTAVFAVLLLSVNVAFVGYSRDARSYALTVLLATVSTYLLTRAVERSTRLAWSLYGLVAGLAVWAHLLAAAILLAQLMWLLLERRSRRFPGVAVGLVVLGAVLAPLALALAVGGQQPQLSWLPPPGVQRLPGLFLWFVESRATLVLYFVGAAAALLFAGSTWRRDRSRRPRSESLLLLWLLVPPAVAFVASFATPLYLYRYFLACLPALVLLVAAGFARLRPAWLGLVLVAATIALSVRTVEGCQPDCKIRHDEWGSAVAYLGSRIRPGDGVVVYPAEVRTPVDHYLPERRPRLLYPERWKLGVAGSSDAAGVEAAIADAGDLTRIWFVTWWLPADEARAALARRRPLLSEREFDGNVHVDLYGSR